jgi:hypothetical protein
LAEFNLLYERIKADQATLIVTPAMLTTTGQDLGAHHDAGQLSPSKPIKAVFKVRKNVFAV